MKNYHEIMLVTFIRLFNEMFIFDLLMYYFFVIWEKWWKKKSKSNKNVEIKKVIAVWW